MEASKLVTILNDSTKKYAWHLGISDESFTKLLTDRHEEMSLHEKSDYLRKDSPKLSKITATRPVLVVGRGPSLKNNIELIRNFTGVILIADMSFGDFVRAGIRHDYVLTMEKHNHEDVRRTFDVELVKSMEKPPVWI